MQVNGFHTAAASNRSRLIERGMDVQVLAGERIEDDDTELELLIDLSNLGEMVPGNIGRLIRDRVARLMKIDRRENTQHGELHSAGIEICRRWEKAERSVITQSAR